MSKKTILNCNSTDPNKILPIQYHWAREHYKAGVANNWTPEEISMQQDIEQWRKVGFLTDVEKHMVLRNLGFFSTAESLTANNIVLSIYRQVSAPECRQFLLRQAFEEAIHNEMFVYCCDSLGLDPDEIYLMYTREPTIKAKDDFVVAMTTSLMDPMFRADTIDNIQKFVKDLVGFYVIMEGIFFYAGFAMMLHLLRSNRMVGIGEQFQYVLRDETVHLAFGADLINTIVSENPGIWTPEFKKEIVSDILQGVELETEYAKECLPTGITGMNSLILRQYLEYIADRRLVRINLPVEFKTPNPLTWMSEIMDLKKEKNFFETRVTEYQTAGQLDWE